MDPNSKQSVVIEAVGSLAYDFAHLNPFTRSGEPPIDRIPNEIMQLIMAKLELDGDVTNLVRLRSVSTKWKALVEDYFGQKKSLIVIDIKLRSNYDFEELRRFFGFAKLKNCTRLFLVSKMSLDCLRSLLGMFPNIVQLSICCYDYYLADVLVDYINTLVSLKQLDFDVPFVSVANFSQTWSKLEHFSINVGSLNDDECLQLVSHLEPSCARVYFKGEFTYGQVHQWHTNNPNWLANLTHLAISLKGTSEECAQFVHYLSEHATSIKILNLTFMSWDLPFEMTPTVIRDLSKLTNLAELKLGYITMDIRKLTEKIAKDELTSIASVLTFKLNILRLVGDGPISGGQFSRVLSVIFPNLAELDLSIGNQHLTQQFQHEFNQHLNRFPKLRNHNINYF